MEHSSDENFKGSEMARGSQPQIQKVPIEVLQNLFETNGNLTGY